MTKRIEKPQHYRLQSHDLHYKLGSHYMVIPAHFHGTAEISKLNNPERRAKVYWPIHGGERVSKAKAIKYVKALGGQPYEA